ncbi:putative late blight resistance protein homolog R1B-8 [Lycium barbarum]|uniref:putative late blight resistance protein homolog R1B-8 n=1 Tax=Lycium barbarum TaxID=112863 RepID=UPI00293F4E7C|nr:putative late blight resistance protein homolog R1B-8 [Lycium barbarum]XP_060177608.1 putative late blight resistance protein homolog R1B-8 [Lycium barbarum]XP_060177609.1 putative late blight resistance protein homolog R1B-8 [Lycium barbarum]
MAYATVTSLVTTLELLLTQTNSGQAKKAKALNPQIESLREKVRSLQALLETLDNINDVEAVKHRETKIKLAVHDAEDRIESILEQLYPSIDQEVHEEAYERIFGSLQQASKSMDSEREELQRSMQNSLQATSSLARSFVLPERSSQLENIMVGHEIEVEDMKSQLMMRTSSNEREVVAIVGMGGIGKTTFTSRVYNDPLIEAYFDIRAWTTMSKEYCIRKMLLELLHCIKDVTHEEEEEEEDVSPGKREKDQAELLKKESEKTDGDLAAELKKKLQRRMYLVVIDDIWSTKAWDDISQWFPDYKGSQILLTTRCGDVASYAAPGKSPHQISLLNPTESWKLFQDKILVNEEQLPPELLEIGKKIAYNCQGLPLIIVVVTGLLSKCNNALDKWKHVEQNVKSALFEDRHQQCEKVLALSYYYLPQHLKACFLYFAVFPEDAEVHANKLIKLWVAEGFLKKAANKSLEDVAEEYFNELIGRNLVFISRHNFYGKVKTCKIHDLLHEFCLREAQRENFLCVIVRDDNRASSASSQSSFS